MDAVLVSRCFNILQETTKSYICKYQYDSKDNFIKDVKELNYTYPGKIFNVNMSNFTIVIDK